MTRSEQTASGPSTQTSDDTDVATLALSLVPGIGPRLFHSLLNHFGASESILQQNASALRCIPGIGATLSESITDPDLLPSARRVLEECRQLQVRVVDARMRHYPARLTEITDPPSVLYVRGDLTAQDELALAIVGSRRCTAYGLRQAERLAAALSRAGFTIISGLARGIDAAAHRGALNAGGRTIAVLASGVRDIYPPEHVSLAEEVIQQGALVSEMPIHQVPKSGLFPQRNRIISGLSLGVIVVEATRRSGALYTARHALEQGREVFAVPGHADSFASDGCHELIRDGVTLIRNADDVLAELGPLATPSQREDNQTIRNPRELVLNRLETEILNRISASPISVDDVLRKSQMDPSRVLATLTVLEMRRFIRRLPGNLFVRS